MLERKVNKVKCSIVPRAHHHHVSPTQVSASFILLFYVLQPYKSPAGPPLKKKKKKSFNRDSALDQPVRTAAVRPGGIFALCAPPHPPAPRSCGFCSLSSLQNEGLNSNEHAGREQLEPLSSGIECPSPPGGLIKVPRPGPSERQDQAWSFCPSPRPCLAVSIHHSLLTRNSNQEHKHISICSLPLPGPQKVLSGD